MLTDQYGIPWILSALELEIACMTDDDQQKVTMEPDLIFSLTMPEYVFPLLNVAETRLCRVNLGFGGVGVPWILGLSARC